MLYVDVAKTRVTSLFGMSVAQVMHYFRWYRNDKAIFKAMVCPTSYK